jgi:hypothetical protein
MRRRRRSSQMRASKTAWMTRDSQQASDLRCQHCYSKTAVNDNDTDVALSAQLHRQRFEAPHARRHWAALLAAVGTKFALFPGIKATANEPRNIQNDVNPRLGCRGCERLTWLVRLSALCDSECAKIGLRILPKKSQLYRKETRDS